MTVFNREIIKFLRWAIAVSAIALLAKVFEIKILSFWLFGLLFLFLVKFLLLVVTFNYLVNLIRRVRQDKFKTVIPLLIIGFSFLVTYLIDPVQSDFSIFLSQRERIITTIKSHQLELQNYRNYSQGVKVELDGDALLVFFSTYSWGWGDGGADYVYRSDDRDISISSQEYQKIRSKLPGNQPVFKQIRKIKDHWFWQEQEW